jgi:hypothetical protein
VPRQANMRYLPRELQLHAPRPHNGRERCADDDAAGGSPSEGI